MSTGTPEWARGLQEAGALPGEWVHVFDAVPRARFLPELIWPYDPDGSYKAIDRLEDPLGWAEAVATDTAIVTQWDNGDHTGRDPGTTPTCSASKPTIVALMLADLDASPGHKVLDVGTGTGWTMALLAERTTRVVGVDTDPAVANAARTALRTAGYPSLPLLTGDGRDGWPEYAPYDRVHVGFAVRTIAPAWITQTRPGGIIVAPWGTRFTNQNAIARLTVTADRDAATGNFTGPAEFMLDRTVTAPAVVHADYLPTGVWPDDTRESSTTVGVDQLWDSHDGAAEFICGALVPDVVHSDDKDDQGHHTVWYSTRCRSWAVVFYRTGDRGRHLVYSGGPRHVWEEVETAYRWWVDTGRPQLTDLGLTAYADGNQEIWHGDPSRVVA
jgi:protein-L-isoaspartate O-methyltransferase